MAAPVLGPGCHLRHRLGQAVREAVLVAGTGHAALGARPVVGEGDDHGVVGHAQIIEGIEEPQALIEAMIALARVGDKALQPKLIASLSRLDLKTVAPEMRLPLLRAWQLVFTRMGKPSAEVCATVAAKSAARCSRIVAI